MNTDEKIIKMLEELQAGQKALQADVQMQGKDIASLKTGQEQQGSNLITTINYLPGLRIIWQRS